MKIQKHVRSQHSVGSSNGCFGGPDTYVAVTICPDDQTVPSVLNQQVLTRRGIKFIYCGEGYSSRQTTTRSALGAALEKADRIVTIGHEAINLNIL